MPLLIAWTSAAKFASMARSTAIVTLWPSLQLSRTTVRLVSPTALDDVAAMSARLATSARTRLLITLLRPR